MFHNTAQRNTANPEDLTARELYEQCRNIGSLALKSRRQFIGLLPLVERRQAYLGRGLYSTYDFAAKLGGISRDIVTEVLRLDRQLCDYPLVRKLLYGGEVGWTKIRLIAGWLTAENQEEWIEKVKNLSHQALQLYMKDFCRQEHRERTPLLLENTMSFVQLTTRDISSESYKNENNDKNKANNFHVEISEYNRSNLSSQEMVTSKFDQLAYERETFTFSLNRQIAAKMRLFRQKLEKDRKELITWEEVMVEFLNHIEKKEEPATQKLDIQKSKAEEETPASRHIPASVRRAVLRQYNGLCAFNDCAAPAQIFHHTRRFSLTDHLPKAETHDPNFIKPLCKPHERIVHNTLIENEEVDPAHWKLLVSPNRQSEKYAVDQIVIGYRKPK